MRQGQQVMPGPATVTPPYGVTSKVTGVELSRLVLVPHPGNWLETVATLVEGLDVVLAAAPPPLPMTASRRLTARLRSRGSTLVVLGPWPNPAARIDVRTMGWQGLGQGYGCLSAQELEVTVVRHHHNHSVRLVRTGTGVHPAEEVTDVC
ncbi:MAG: hypothetical protein E7A56_11470 [Cutibacterium avidum]|nr:hypothetical protein [Cutibacterium avidum]